MALEKLIEDPIWLHQPLQLQKLRPLFLLGSPSKVSLLAVVDRTERRKGRKFTKRSQTSRKSAKRMRDFPVREGGGTVGRGPGAKNYHANGPLPLPLG